MRLARTYALTDPGRRRRRNEDAYVVSPPLFAVADGMGGAQAGELASRIAVEAMGEESGTSGEERVATLIREANRRIFTRSHEDAAVSGMGTTMTIALLEDGGVTFGHVGDSRAYVARGDELVAREGTRKGHEAGVLHHADLGSLHPGHGERSVLSRREYSVHVHGLFASCQLAPLLASRPRPGR
jgi:serine/threonine protein phosphatase PrpC